MSDCVRKCGIRIDEAKDLLGKQKVDEINHKCMGGRGGKCSNLQIHNLLWHSIFSKSQSNGSCCGHICNIVSSFLQLCS